MHRFLRAAGFSMYQKKKDIRALLRCLAREAGTSSCLQLDRETELYEIKTEVAPGIGVAMYGELNEQDEMEIEYYYPERGGNLAGRMFHSASYGEGNLCGASG